MGRNNWFRFKQFTIVQERSAMKVGTDGVLLGAWVNVSSAKKILDVGTGTGLIALMLAQRSDADITAIEIEKNAATEAFENVKNSPWKNRITIINAPFQEYANNSDELFDLIVSNPPFFINSRKPSGINLAIAKHNHLLTLAELASCSAKLLNAEGRLAVILPVTTAGNFINEAVKQHLCLLRETEVRPNNLKNAHRYLLEFGKYNCIPEKDCLRIHHDDGKDFTEEYKMLTADFYLNF
jgi:tRNA1Val (adenine37-N6)-methyltransferase